MKFVRSTIPEVVIIEPSLYGDDRGWFMETFNEPRFHQGLRELGLPVPRAFVQDNHSCSRRGVLRGLHYQRAPHAQGKLVRVTKGAAFDVAVDIRPNSETFGRWVGVELSEHNNRMLWIPEGFAHGFIALEDDTHFLYKTTDIYTRDAEGSIRWDDPTLAIDWPLTDALIVSEKDAQAPTFDAAINGVAAPVHSAQGLGLQFQIKGDQRGALVALERGGDVPFPIARVYYLTHTKPGISRGFHAHRELQQLAVCVAGRCRMLMDDGVSRVDYWLDTPDRGVLIPPGVWHEMHDFSDDCVLLVLASAPYEESDYIRDYSAFREAVKHG